MTPTPTYDPSVKQKAEAKTSRIPIKVVAAETLKKPDWIRVKAGSPTTRFYEIKQILREHKLHTVCEEASCPNIGECFGKGTATFMIMGDKCTRRCPFCDVGHGRPDPLDPTSRSTWPRRSPRSSSSTWSSPASIATTCATAAPATSSTASGRPAALARHADRDPDARFPRPHGPRARDPEGAPPDVMNHNLETAPRLYKEARPVPTMRSRSTC